MAKRGESSKPPSRSQNASPEFMFVTTTNPEQFKDKEVMKDIRRSVMHDYLSKAEQDPNSTDKRIPRNRESKKRRRPRSSDEQSSPQDSVAVQGSTQGLASMPTSSPSLVSAPNISRPSTHMTEVTSTSHRQRPYSQIPCTSWSHTHGLDSNLDASSDGTRLFIRQHRNLLTDPGLFDFAHSQSISPGIDGPTPHLDTYGLGPHFDNDLINVERLKHHCSAYFGTHAINRHLVPMMLDSRPSFLSCLGISAAYVDMMRLTSTPYTAPLGPIDSQETLQIRHEVIQMITACLQDPFMRTHDLTILAVAQLLCADMISGNIQGMSVHEKGLRQMIVSRGGLDTLGGNGVIATVITITALELAILRELEPDPIYLDYANRHHLDIASPSSTLSPESPLYRPLSEFITITGSRNCCESTLELIQLMHDLTENFLELTSFPTRAQLRNMVGPIEPRHSPARMAILQQEIKKIASHTRRMPSAMAPGHAATGDSYYESCRLCAVLYSGALIHKTPFSATYIDTGAHVRVIKAALNRTDLHDCWGNMTGVLFWITLVAEAACNACLPPVQDAETDAQGHVSSADTSASSSTIGGDQELQEGPLAHGGALSSRTSHSAVIVREGQSQGGDTSPETESEDQRRPENMSARHWFIGTAVRCSILLRYEHTSAMLQTLDKMVKVQRVLRRGRE